MNSDESTPTDPNVSDCGAFEAMALTGNAREEKLGEAAESLRRQMEDLASQLKDLILTQPPVELLGYLWAQLLMARIQRPDAGEETEVHDPEGDQPVLFALEYMHAVLSSFEPAANQDSDFDEATAGQIIEASENLRQTALFYSMASSELRDGEFGEATGQVEFSAKSTWILIRGNRYQVLEGEFFQFILEPHDEVLRKAYGIGAEGIASQIQAVADAQRVGSVRAIESINDAMNRTHDLAASEKISVQDAIEKIRSQEPAVQDKLAAAYDDLFFGGVCNLSKHTELPRDLLHDLSYARGDATDFFQPGDFVGTPFRTLPARIRPLVLVDDDYYATDPQFVRDSAYRALQRGIIARFPEYKEEWNSRQKTLTENAFHRIFSKQLAGANVYREYYYRNLTTNDWVECDTLILLDDVLIQVEAKAGVSAMQSPATNFQSHVRTIKNLVVNAYWQARRFLEYLQATPNAPIYELRNGTHVEVERIQLSNYRVVLPIGLTVESFSPFSTMCKELPDIEPILGQHPFVSMSIDDLFVLNRFLSSGGELLHYLMVRQAVSGLRRAMIFDETDHLGAYIKQNRFDITIREQFAQGADMVTWDKFSEPIDQYFSGEDWDENEPPSQPYPPELENILNALDDERPPRWLWVDTTIRNLGCEARDNLSKTFRQLVESLDKFETRYFLLFGEPPLLVWISRAGSEIAEEAIVHKSEVAAIATRADEILCVHLSVQQDGSLTRPICRVTGTPLSSRADYNDLLREAAAMEERTVDIATGEKRQEVGAAKAGKIGRNEPCWCGSGKKFKKCHGSPMRSG